MHHLGVILTLLHIPNAHTDTHMLAGFRSNKVFYGAPVMAISFHYEQGMLQIK